MRKRILIIVGAVLLFIAGEVSGVTQATCGSSSLSVLSACVNKNFTSVQSQINSLNTKLTALTTKVTALQNGTVTPAGLAGNYSIIATGYSHDASGGTGLNITSLLTQGTLTLNGDMSFSLSQTKDESLLQLTSASTGQSTTDLQTNVAPQVVTSVTSSVTPSSTPKSSTGTWSLVANTLTLTPVSGNPISFTVANGGRVFTTVDEAGSVWLGIQTP